MGYDVKVSFRYRIGSAMSERNESGAQDEPGGYKILSLTILYNHLVVITMFRLESRNVVRSVTLIDCLPIVCA